MCHVWSDLDTTIKSPYLLFPQLGAAVSTLVHNVSKTNTSLQFEYKTSLHDVYCPCAGGSVRLHCSVTNVESSSVSWIRLSDFQILANGLGTFTTDPRSEL